MQKWLTSTKTVIPEYIQIPLKTVSKNGCYNFRKNESKWVYTFSD